MCNPDVQPRARVLSSMGCLSRVWIDQAKEISIDSRCFWCLSDPITSEAEANEVRLGINKAHEKKKHQEQSGLTL